MVPVSRPYIPVQPSIYVLVNNVFSPEEETERDWDTDLAEDFKAECEAKYGPVANIKVEKESQVRRVASYVPSFSRHLMLTPLYYCHQGEVYIQFANLEAAGKGVAGLNGRFFGGRSLVANVNLNSRLFTPPHSFRLTLFSPTPASFSSFPRSSSRPTSPSKPQNRVRPAVRVFSSPFLLSSFPVFSSFFFISCLPQILARPTTENGIQACQRLLSPPPVGVSRRRFLLLLRPLPLLALC